MTSINSSRSCCGSKRRRKNARAVPARVKRRERWANGKYRINEGEENELAIVAQGCDGEAEMKERKRGRVNKYLHRESGVEKKGGKPSSCVETKAILSKLT